MSYWSPSVYGGSSLSLRRALAGLVRRRARPVRRTGRGVLDWIKSAASKVGSTALDVGKTIAIDLAKKKLGLGRRRRTGRGPIGSALGGVLGGLLGFGRRKRTLRRGRALIPGGRRRALMPRRRIGRGPIGSALGGVLGGLLGFGRKRRVLMPRRRRLLM